MDEIEILRAMRELLARPDGWTQGAYARTRPVTQRNAEQNENYVESIEHGSCFCLQGAYSKVTDGKRSQSHYKLDNLLGGCLPEHVSSTTFNDHPGRTQEEIVGLLDCALAARTSTSTGTTQ